MRLKVFAIVLVSMLLAGLATIPMARAEVGPKSDYLLIHMYTHPDIEFAALEAGEIDIVDWELTKYWIDRWAANPDIEMRDYSAMSFFELTPNHQKWPTGAARDPVTEPPGTKHRYDDTNAKDVAAKHFRKAIAYLCDKDRYVTEIAKGYGFRCETSLPYPAFSGWVDYADLDAKGLLYRYSPSQAWTELTTGGFDDWDNDKVLEWSPDGGSSWEELPSLIFYARSDHPLRFDSASLLKGEMEKLGPTADIKVNINFLPRDSWDCYLGVMIGNATGYHDFHLYTSGWIFTSPSIDGLYDTYHETMCVEQPEEFSWNYGGFAVGDGIAGTADDAYDYNLYATKLKKEALIYDDVKAAGLKTQEIMSDLVATVPWWAPMGVKAYRAGWEDFVNHVTLGVDGACSNRFTFLSAHNPTDNTIDWGFKQEPGKVNRITAEWMWEENAIFGIYDDLVRHNPYNLAVDYPWIAAPMFPGADGVLGSPENPGAYYDDVWEETGTWAGGMWIKFKVQTGIKFHGDADGVGGLDDLTPEDVRFTLLFTRDCGPGIAWSYPSVADVVQVDTHDQDATLGTDEVKVYLSVSTYWVHYWIMYFYVLNKKVWAAANNRYAWGYDMVNDQPTGTFDPLKVKAYKPESDDGNYNGIPDLKEDGAGPWIFESWAKGETMLLSGFKAASYHKTQTEISGYLAQSFNRMGNVNYEGAYHSVPMPPEDKQYPFVDWVIRVEDGMYVARALGTDIAGFYSGIDFMEFNRDSDFNRDDKVWGYDLFSVGINMWKDAG